jgi:hypothetical protein
MYFGCPVFGSRPKYTNREFFCQSGTYRRSASSSSDDTPNMTRVAAARAAGRVAAAASPASRLAPIERVAGSRSSVTIRFTVFFVVRTISAWNATKGAASGALRRAWMPGAIFEYVGFWSRVISAASRRSLALET